MRPLIGFCLQIINVDRRNFTAIETVICRGRHHGNSIFFLLFSYTPTKIPCLGNLFQKLSKRGQKKNNFLTDFSLLSCSHCKCAQFQFNTFTYLSSGFLLHQHFTHITAQGVTAGTWGIRWLVDWKTKNFAFFQIQRCRSSENVDQR